MHKCLLLPYSMHACMMEDVYNAFNCCIFVLPVSHVIRPLMQLVARVGIRLTGNFAYQIEPEVCIKLGIGSGPKKNGSSHDHSYALESGKDSSIKPWVTVTYCCAAYSSWPDSYVDLYAYYQIRKIKWLVSLH